MAMGRGLVHSVCKHTYFCFTPKDNVLHTPFLLYIYNCSLPSCPFPYFFFPLQQFLFSSTSPINSTVPFAPTFIQSESISSCHPLARKAEKVHRGTSLLPKLKVFWGRLGALGARFSTLVRKRGMVSMPMESQSAADLPLCGPSLDNSTRKSQVALHQPLQRSSQGAREPQTSVDSMTLRSKQ